MKRLVRYKLSFTTLLNYQLYKWVKISLEGRFVSSYLLLSSMDSQKKTPNYSTFILFSGNATYWFLMNLFPPLYLLLAFDGGANFPYVAS